ncbi:response regulator transcription factor (plasmid) [Deinococcus radiomollis]
MTRRSVLVIDSDTASAERMSTALQGAGYDVVLARSVVQGLILARETMPSLVVTELSLPDGTGADVVTRLASSDIPVLMVSARDNVLSKVSLLRSRKVDHVVKPFEVQEFLIRAMILLRDRREKWEELVVGELVLDVQRRQVRFGGHDVDLTVRERDVLEVLMREPERVFTYQELQERVWGTQAIVTSGRRNGLAVMVVNIRKKLGAAGACGYLLTSRGTGYVLRTRSRPLR